MRPGRTRPTVDAMNDGRLLRLGAVAALAGAAAQVVASALEPDCGGDPGKAVRGGRERRLERRPPARPVRGLYGSRGPHSLRADVSGRAGREWSHAGQPFLVLMAALGSAAVLSGADMKQMADRWTDARPGAKQSDLAAFDASSMTTEDLFFGAFRALGFYIAALAAAILLGGLYARWIGWAAGVSAVLVVTGDLLDIAFDAAFVAVLAGFAVFLTVLIALGLAMWRRAAAANAPDPSAPTSASGLNRRRARMRQAGRATQVE